MLPASAQPLTDTPAEPQSPDEEAAPLHEVPVSIQGGLWLAAVIMLAALGIAYSIPFMMPGDAQALALAYAGSILAGLLALYLVKSALWLRVRFIAGAEGLHVLPPAGEPELVRRASVTRVRQRPHLQRMELVTESGRAIALEYQLTDFAALAEAVCRHAPPAALPGTMSGQFATPGLLPSIFHRAGTRALLLALVPVAIGGSDEGIGGDSSSFAPPAESVRASAPAPGGVADTLWLLASDPANDAVRASDTEATLIARYGAGNVERAEIDQGEGMLVPGTILFPRDSVRRLAIQWDDTVARSRPLQVVVSSRAGGWQLSPGIGMGTTLAELERLNGGPFELGGFGGHYPGVVTSWKGGRLSAFDEEGGQPSWRRAMIRVRPADPYHAGVDPDRVDTESLFLSSDPAMQLLQPRVVSIAVRPR